jgi:uncharacterized protein YjdB
MSSTIQDILNTIKDNASEEYSTRIPEATRTNIAEIGNSLLDLGNKALMNEFVSSLVQRISMTIIRQKVAKNKLAVLKKGRKPLGNDIQEIFTNLAKGTQFDPSGQALLKRTIPDVKVLYHRRNRESQYPATITRAQLKDAFVSAETLERFMQDIIQSLYNADTQDEFILMKNLLADAVLNDKVVQLKVDPVTNVETATSLLEAMTTASSGFEFMSSAWNKYYENRPITDKGDPVQTWCPLENQVLVIRADILNKIKIRVLAGVFNLSEAEMKAKIITVDSFGKATNVLAMLIDDAFVQAYDDMEDMDTFYNPQGKYWNYWLDHWQTISFTYFANAVAFVDSEPVSLDKAELTFTEAEAQTLTATTVPVGGSVTWSSSNTAVATVVNGTVTPVADGFCQINASFTDAKGSVFNASSYVTVDLA